MQLDSDACYRALRTRDARFDGHFFTAVRSTGIYCRPICPAPTPKRENCLFVGCAAAAQEAGFRPCLRCRPEASPGTPAWLGTSATVSRALRLIADGALDADGVGRLAERLGIGERHLRRLFIEHLGATPMAVAQTRRLLFAKKLIDETRLPLAQVAFAAGFQSIRRFNSAMREVYGRSPRELRGARGVRAAAGAPIDLKLAYRPPFDWEALLRFLAPRATPGVELVQDDRYCRTLRIDGVRGWVEVRALPGEHQLLARLYLSGPAPLIEIAERLRRIFDLGADPRAIADHLVRDRLLARRLAAVPGVRVPGGWDGFEVAVRTILGQQISVGAATRLAGRLARLYGEPLAAGASAPELCATFPAPAALRRVDATKLGVPRRRAETIAALAAAVADGRLALDGGSDPEDTLRTLSALPGIGPWTAQVVAMRALREPDAFPAGDLGLRQALGRRSHPAPAAQVERRARAWRPWRAYAAQLLWSAPR